MAIQITQETVAEIFCSTAMKRIVDPVMVMKTIVKDVNNEQE